MAIVAKRLGRGYVALAVAKGSETASRELDTGLGDDRAANMTAFCYEALNLLREVISAGT